MREMTKKEAIVTAAAELFAEKGFTETTASEVAERARVAQGTLFYHFKTKENILLEVFESIMDRYQAGMEGAVRTTENGLSALEALLKFQFAFVEENSRVFLVVLRDFPSFLAHSDSPQKARVHARLAAVSDVLRGILERGRKDGSIRDLPIESTVQILRGLTSGLIRHRLLGFSTSPPGSDEVVDFCRQALQPPAG
jgi:TetR/AcrR family transcriptional regulator, fatty acid metabolism regulator protein